MNDIETLLSDTADYFELQLHHRPKAEQDLILAVAQGSAPEMLRVVAPKVALLIRVQDIPK